MNQAIQPLEIFIGRWNTTLILLNPDGSEGAVSKATDTYTWLPNGHFLLHEVDAEMHGERAQSIEVYAAGDNGGYQSRSFDADGSINDFTARLDGHAWTITGQHQRFSGAFHPDAQTLEGLWEQNTDGHWAAFLKLKLRK